jgi:hypothetical protein
VHFISTQLRENKADAKVAASSALFRLSSFKAVRTCLSGNDIREICFQLARKKEKALKRIEKKSVPLMWVSILITLDFENDKIWVGMYLILEYKGLTLHSSENSADSSKLQGTEL